MKSSLVIGASIIIAALIVSATTALVLRYDNEWRGKTLIKIDRLTGKMKVCTLATPMVLVCLPVTDQ